MFSHGLFFGMSYGSRVSIFMGLTNPAVAATQFTAYMALSNVAIATANAWQGIIAERFSYTAALYLDAALLVLAVAVMPFLKKREAKPDRLSAEPATQTT